MAAVRLFVLAVFTVVLALSSTSSFGQVVPGPVIGVMTQSYNSTHSYLAASYVKYLESAGARVVPIPYQSSAATIAQLFHSLNGILFPGGDQDLSNFNDPYMVALQQIFTLTLNANDDGDFFPLWGTCLGFQALNVLAAQTGDVLTNGFDSEDLPLPLNFTSIAPSSRLYGACPPSLYQAMATEAITMNNHQAGVAPQEYVTNTKLKSFYKLLSTNVDREGRPFASSIEAFQYPIFGTQYHPEKNSFEWTPSENIPHTSNAVAMCQYTAKFFVDQARQSNHTYDPTQLNQDIIYNYSPVFTGIQGSDFDQIYFWANN